MAMGLMNNLAHELTGNINRAYILMRASSKSPKEKAELMPSGKLHGSAWTDEAAVGRFAKKKHFIPIKVQYNPSSIDFSGERENGEGKDQNVTAESSEKYKQDSVYPVNMILRTELIFDDTNIADAFSKIDSGKFSETGAIKAAAGEISNAVGKAPSVQDITELFVAAACSAYTRTVCFLWGNQEFWGELTKVDVQYTMFNKKGSPIRAKVTIEIRQDIIESLLNDDGRINSKKRYKTEQEWDKKFEKMFQESQKLAKNKHLSDSSNKLVSNIFNFK